MPPIIKTLYWLALLDGVALLALVGIGVPMKYAYDWPTLVKILGPTHGVLFISLTFTLVTAWMQSYLKWPMAALVFFGALLPGGAFFADHQLKKQFASTDTA